jgi:acetoin utilization protein AcuB
MLVKHRMTPKPFTVTTDTSVKEALELLDQHPFRHLPVVDASGNLRGVVTNRSLLLSSPTSATTLSVFEVDYILSHTQIGQVMSSPAVAVEPDLPLEEAARLMIDNHIGCLPVVEGEKLVGIISDTDIFRVFVEGLGGGHPSPRITVVVPEEVGSLAKVTGCIADIGGNIYSLGIFWGDTPEDRVITLRIEGVDKEAAVQALESADIPIVTVWEPPKE